jgi:hypothetical protein
VEQLIHDHGGRRIDHLHLLLREDAEALPCPLDLAAPDLISPPPLLDDQTHGVEASRREPTRRRQATNLDDIPIGGIHSLS